MLLVQNSLKYGKQDAPPYRGQQNHILLHSLRRLVYLCYTFCSELDFFSILTNHCLQLRQSFFVRGRNTEYNAVPNPKENNTDNGYDSEDPGNEPPDFDMPEDTYIYEDVPQQDKVRQAVDVLPYLKLVCVVKWWCCAHLDKWFTFQLLCSMMVTFTWTEMKVMKIPLLMQALKIFVAPTW